MGTHKHKYHAQDIQRPTKERDVKRVLKRKERERGSDGNVLETLTNTHTHTHALAQSEREGEGGK